MEPLQTMEKATIASQEGCLPLHPKSSQHCTY